MALMKIIYTIWLREIKRFLREKPRIIGNLATPFMWFILMGIGLSSVTTLGSNYLGFVLPGVIGMSILFTSIFSGVSVIYDKQFGFLKEILVAPVPRSSIVLGKVAGSATISIINGIIILVLGTAMGVVQINSLGQIFGAILVMGLISFSFVSIGIAIASRLSSMEGFQVIMSFIVMPLFMLSGTFFPLDSVPAWMKYISIVDPLMYGVDGLRSLLLGTSEFPLYVDLFVLGTFSAMMILISTYLFGKINE